MYFEDCNLQKFNQFQYFHLCTSIKIVTIYELVE